MGRADASSRIMAAAALVLCMAPTRTIAQEARGEIIDSSRQPVVAAYVALMDQRRRIVVTTLSDDRGVFSLVAPSPGRYFVYMARLGYRSLLNGPYELEVGMALELFAVMHTLPVALEGVEVVVTSAEDVPRLVAAGFYNRRDASFGTFFDREDIENSPGQYVTDLLRGVPRMTVMRTTGAFGASRALRGPEVRMRSSGLKGQCTPTLYLDGIVVAMGGSVARNPLRPDDYVTPDMLEAIEIYTGAAQAPIQYMPIAGCGVILFWTRHERLERR